VIILSSLGKIYHPHSPPNDDGNLTWSNAYLPYPEWSQESDRCPGGHHYDAFLEIPVIDGGKSVPANSTNGPACPMPNDANLTDTRIKDLALKNLRRVARLDAPWVGSLDEDKLMNETS
jgi:hypothetical protein